MLANGLSENGLLCDIETLIEAAVESCDQQGLCVVSPSQAFGGRTAETYRPKQIPVVVEPGGATTQQRLLQDRLLDAGR